MSRRCRSVGQDAPAKAPRMPHKPPANMPPRRRPCREAPLAVHNMDDEDVAALLRGGAAGHDLT